MSVRDVKKAVGDLPYMSVDQAKRLTKFIRKNGVRDVLELGFFHGVSSCYIADEIAERGGTLTTIDLESARKRDPDIIELLERTGLREQVDVYFEPRSFTWRLMKMLEDGQGPRFDLAYLDGGHTWDVTGFAFFLVDRLLRPGGWLIFDDINWSYATSKAFKDKPAVQAMPEDYRTTPQVRKVFELLVEPHPDYHRCKVEDGWGYAQKKPA